MSSADRNARCLGGRCVSRYPEHECVGWCSLAVVLKLMAQNPDRGCLMPDLDRLPTLNRYTNRLNELGLCDANRPTRITPDGKTKAAELRE